MSTRITRTFIFLAAIFTIALSGTAMAEQVAGFDGKGIDTEHALRLSVSRGDFMEMSRGVEDLLKQQVIRGTYEGPIKKEYWFATVTVRDISYQLQVRRLHISPETGRVHAFVSIKNVRANVGFIGFNQAETSYCKNMPISSGNSAIPAVLDLYPRVANQDLYGVVANEIVDLNQDNFKVSAAQSCDVLWGFNWLIRRILPWIVGKARAQIGASLGVAISKTITDYAKMVNDIVLHFNITLPFDIKPFPAFYGTLGTYPSKVELSKGEAAIVVGSNVEISPDKALHEDYKMPKDAQYILQALNLPSWVGISRMFMNSILREASDKGLFRLEISERTYPDIAEMLTAEGLFDVLPDSASRFSGDEQVSLFLNGVESTEIVIEPATPERDAKVSLMAERIRLNVWVDGKPYFDLYVTGKMPLILALDPSDNRFVILLKELGTATVEGNFVAGLDPVPTDETFNKESVEDLLAMGFEHILSQWPELFSVVIPEVDLGTRFLDIRGVSARGNYVSLDAAIGTRSKP